MRLTEVLVDIGSVVSKGQLLAQADDHIGATIMGRNMFGPVRGDWPDESSLVSRIDVAGMERLIAERGLVAGRLDADAWEALWQEAKRTVG